MNKFELVEELKTKYHLKELQQIELVEMPNDDITQEQIERVWESSDAHYLLLVDEEECQEVYNKLFS